MTETALRTNIDAVRDTVITWRRHLHQNPELSFQEERTAQFVADMLAEFGGLEITRPTATSVLARLRGAKPGPVLAIRADMDALPILEKNSHDFVSRTPGVMHACGHDGHTAMLLGAAKILASDRDELAGEVRFIFQHAEELYPGGEAMVQAGVMDGVALVIGAHLWLPMALGSVGVKTGALMAAPDTFRITITGSGGHAAAPHQTIDAIAIGAQVVTNLQHIVSRNVDPLDHAVVSVTQFNGGTPATNVIPGTVELAGTVRTFDPALRASIPQLMERIVRGVTQAHGATHSLSYENGYRPVINDETASALLRRSVVTALGAEALVEATPTMGGEDFSAYQQRAPGSFFFIGARNEERGIIYPHHHERFDIDERALDHGTRIFVAAARDFLTPR